MRHTIINNSHCNVYRIRKLFRSIDVQSDDTFSYFTEAAVVNNDKWPQHIVRTWFWRRHQEFLFSTEQRLLCAHYLISKTETMPSRQRLRQSTRRIHEVDTEGGENSCRQRCVSFFCLFLSFLFSFFLQELPLRCVGKRLAGRSSNNSKRRSGGGGSSSASLADLFR